MPTNITIELHDFKENEILHIKAPSLYDASYQYGYQTKHIVQQKLEELWQGVSDTEKSRQLAWTLMAYKKLCDVTESGLCVVDGVNWLQRYIETLVGFAKGAAISAGEAVILQLEIEVGCQNIITAYKQDRRIRFIHSEEDGNNHIPDLDPYPYRWVDMQLPDKEIEFFIYPGLCGWGPAFGINKTTGLIQLVNDLHIKDQFYTGALWCNAIAFMSLDCGSINIIEQLFNKISHYPDTKFAGGYAINLIESQPIPRMAQVEFAHNDYYWLPVNETDEAYWYCHTNCPISLPLHAYSTAAYPQKGQPWSIEEAQSYVEMHYKQQRLETYAQKLNWNTANREESISKGLQLLANPESDIQEVHDTLQVRWLLCNLPSIWTAAHTVGYISPQEVSMHVGKLTPPPLPDKPYELHYRPDYPYILRNLWHEAELLYEQYLHSERKEPNEFE